MATFKDANGKKRTLNITFRTIFKVASETGLDLFNPAAVVDNGKTVEQELLYNPGALGKAVYAICAEEDESQDAFFEALDGKSFHEAENAFWDEYSDFFIHAGREWLAAAIASDLKEKNIREEAAMKTVLDSQKTTSSDSSSQAESGATGKTARTGN